MKQDDVIRLARKAGIEFGEHIGLLNRKVTLSKGSQRIEQFESFAKLVAEHEREAIWNILFEYAGRDDLTPEDESLLKHIADLIKARGQA